MMVAIALYPLHNGRAGNAHNWIRKANLESWAACCLRLTGRGQVRQGRVWIGMAVMARPGEAR